MLLYSLHAQRCFSHFVPDRLETKVFSACAEMFPSDGEHELFTLRILCMRRDVSIPMQIRALVIKYSLHAQRCFCTYHEGCQEEKVFSACAEMFPIKAPCRENVSSILCMRRDVSS